MKNYLTIPYIALLFFICFSNTAMGQTKKVIINFKDKSIDSLQNLEKLGRGETYQIQIDSINLNLYKVTINNMDSTIETPLAFPFFSSFSNDALSGLLAKLSALGDKVGPVIVPTPRESLKMVQRDGVEVSGKMLWPEDMVINQPSELEMVLFEKLLNTELNIIALFKNDIDNFCYHLHNYLLSYTVLYKKSDLYTALKSDFTSIASILDSIKDYRKKIDTILREVVNDYYFYDLNVSKYRLEINKNKGLKERDSLLRVSYWEFLKVIDSASSKMDSKFSTDIMKTIISLDNNASETFVSLPLQFTGDKTDLTITISPKDATSNLPEFSTRYIFPIKKSTFYGVSSSFFMTNMHDSAYSVQTKIGIDTTYSLIPETPGRFQFGFSAMFKFGMRVNSNNFFQLGIGPGITITDKIKPRLLAGLGYAYGDKHKLIIDIGANIGYVDRLSKVYSTDVSYKIQPSDYMVSSIRMNLYFSLGYIFTL